MSYMLNNLIEKKNKIVEWIQPSRYEKMIEFINYICLSDADLIVLIARKCSNFYMAMLPLALVENGGVLNYAISEKYKKRFFRKKKNPPKIVTDRAMHMLKAQITKGEFKRILVVDDLIIHGRTLHEKCCDIKELFSSCGIDKKSYRIDSVALAKCQTGLIDSEFVKNCKSFITCFSDEWKSLSDDIVSIIHICNIAYTSYVPNMVVPMDSEVGCAIKRIIDNNKMFIPYGGEDMTSYGDQSYIYADNSVHRAVWSSSIRIYKYQSLNQYMLIPLVTLNPVDGETLNNYIDCLSEVVTNINYIDVDTKKSNYNSIEKSDEIVSYRSVVYVLSALAGWKFIHDELQCTVSNLKYETTEEVVNFGYKLLKPDIQKKLDVDGAIETIMGNVSKHYKSVEALENSFNDDKDIAQLQEKFDELIKDYNAECISASLKDFIGKFMWISGQIDEERLNSPKTKEQRRLLGYPLSKLGNSFNELRKSLVEAILFHADKGECSVVSRSLMYSGNKYFFSVIHAGEQNYKYYVDNYFPILYGFYFLEINAKDRKQWSKVKAWKEIFLEKYIQDKKPLIFNMDRDDLLNLNIINDYRSILLTTMWSYSGDEYVHYAVEKAKEIIDTA